MIELFRERKYLQFLLLIVVFILMCMFIPAIDGNWLWRFPPLLKQFPIFLSDSIYYLMEDWWLIDVYDPVLEEYEKKPLVREITRGIAGVVLFMIEFIRELLLGGVKTIVTFTSWDWVTENKWARWPGMPWTVVTGGAFILAYRLSGIKLALFTGFAFVYIAVFGQWEPSMQTLSFVLVAAPMAIFIGLFFGIWAYKSKSVENLLNPLLNIAQIMPHFSYLIPVLVFFSNGDHAGAVATVIYATPPMVRLTLLGLKKVPPEVVEAGRMSGCTEWQLLRRVLIPTARTDILLGVNQVIMQCLAMVVIASLIGAKGLGSNLLIALYGQRVGSVSYTHLTLPTTPYV